MHHILLITRHFHAFHISFSLTLTPPLPPLPTAFPQNSYSEWSDYRFYGLRSAMAYMFVFDLTSYDSFTHIKALRDQVSHPGTVSPDQ